MIFLHFILYSINAQEIDGLRLCFKKSNTPIVQGQFVLFQCNDVISRHKIRSFELECIESDLNRICLILEVYIIMHDLHDWFNFIPELFPLLFWCAISALLRLITVLKVNNNLSLNFITKRSLYLWIWIFNAERILNYMIDSFHIVLSFSPEFSDLWIKVMTLG